MSLINRDEVVKVATISAISLHESEIDILTKELEVVLEYASSLQKIKTKSSVNLPKNSNVFRNDEVVLYPEIADIIIRMAPEREDNLYVVPVIVK